MDQATYLERVEALATKVLPDVALMQSRGDHTSATQLVTALRTELDSLWAQRVATAQQTVAP